MKRTIVLAAVLSLAMTAFSSLAFAAAGDGGAGNGIKLTAHDMSLNGGGHNYGDTVEQAGLDRVCIYCHAPHHTLKPLDYAGKVDYLPLWNHELTTVTMWDTYSNGSDDPNDPDHDAYSEHNSGEPGGISKLCLSCHDGSVAANSYGFAPSSSTHDLTGAADAFVLPNTRVSIGNAGNLSNHHPIGFVYDEVVDNEIAPSATTFLGTNSVGQLLWQGKMECSTCHDVHNTENTGEKFLWVSDRNSDLCLTCHLKNQ